MLRLMAVKTVLYTTAAPKCRQNSLPTMIKKDVTIVNKLGLHARAAAKLVSLAANFDCDFYVAKEGREVNGKSIMGVMMLAASKNSTITLITNGEEEQQAITAIEQLVLDRFGEEE